MRDDPLPGDAPLLELAWAEKDSSMTDAPTKEKWVTVDGGDGEVLMFVDDEGEAVRA